MKIQEVYSIVHLALHFSERREISKIFSKDEPKNLMPYTIKMHRN